jgi:hypothetical protein
MSLIAATGARVPAQTAHEINQKIEQRLRDRLSYFADHRDEIALRLRELDAEWDIERAIEANASTLSLFGLAAGILRHPSWLALPVMVSGFLLQHAVQGWCPPVPVLRHLGFRTAAEIERERYALKALRGDFKDLQEGPAIAASVLHATQA